MQVNVCQERMLVISDIHMGSPLFKGIHMLEQFFEYSIQNRFDVCINGDGIDISQSSWLRISREVPIIFQKIAKMRSLGLKVYYVIGNHDIILEYFLQDWQYIELLPFINLTCNNKRIRIEHGHIYDARYVRSATLFKWLEIFGGKILRFTPGIYRAYVRLEKKFYGTDITGTDGLLGRDDTFYRAVRELTQRGYDAVIMGHTHRPGFVKLEDEKIYINLGSWIENTYFVQILNGEIELKDFSKIDRKEFA